MVVHGVKLLYNLGMKRLITIGLWVALAASSCAWDINPTARYIEDVAEIKGTYDLIVYGARSRYDELSYAVLDKAGDAYTFRPVARDDEYWLKKGLSAREAIAEVEHRFSKLTGYYGFVAGSIADKNGTIVGYELQPRLIPVPSMENSPLYITYSFDESGTVNIYLDEDTGFKSMIFMQRD